MKYVVKVNPLMKDHADQFIKNRRQNIADIRKFLINNDFLEIGKIGHRLKGVGGSYGFDMVSEIGALIEEAVENRKDRAGIEGLCNKMIEYLDNVELV